MFDVLAIFRKYPHFLSRKNICGKNGFQTDLTGVRQPYKHKHSHYIDAVGFIYRL